MTPLTRTQPFARWVANTVYAVSGIEPDFIDIDGECLLTYALSRMPACQDGFDDFLARQEQGSMRLLAIAPTNNGVLH